MLICSTSISLKCNIYPVYKWDTTALPPKSIPEIADLIDMGVSAGLWRTVGNSPGYVVCEAPSQGLPEPLPGLASRTKLGCC